jgi:hypothetical protein
MVQKKDNIRGDIKGLKILDDSAFMESKLITEKIAKENLDIPENSVNYTGHNKNTFMIGYIDKVLFDEINSTFKPNNVKNNVIGNKNAYIYASNREMNSFIIHLLTTYKTTYSCYEIPTFGMFENE